MKFVHKVHANNEIKIQ